jgi:ketosteroid isomerase-like protein
MSSKVPSAGDHDAVGGEPVNKPLETQVDELLSKQAIYETLARYCRGVDRCDAEVLASAFHEDAVNEAYGMSGNRRIAAAVTEAVRAMSVACAHVLGSVSISVYGDEAESESYFVAYHTLETDGRHYIRTRGGRYIDRHERRDGRWAIAVHTVVDDWSRLDECAPVPGSGSWLRGARSTADPVYTLREFGG